MDKVNLYLLQNGKNQIGGNFYNVYVSKKNDLEIPLDGDIETFETESKEIDDSFKKAGGIILKKDQYIDDTHIYKNMDEEEEYIRSKEEIDERIIELYYAKDRLFKEYLKMVIEYDSEIRKCYQEKEKLEIGYQKKLVK